MPRAKRKLTEVTTQETDVLVVVSATTETKTSNVQESEAAEGSGRPKRARKQTQKYTSAPETSRKPRAPRKTTASAATRSANKGKGKATVSPRDEDQENPASVGGGAIEPSKREAQEAEVTEPASQKKEKRLAPFRSHCPQNVLERAERVRIQRFFMIDRIRNGKELKEEFKVLGSTGNVYTVVVDHKPKCDCPDNRRGNHCKHIMFIFLKVLLVPISSHIWYQKALLTSELETVFSQAPEAPNSVMNPRIQEAFLRATGKLGESSSAATSGKRRIPGEDDDCPICYDTMHGVPEASLVFCEECGNALHKECFTQYETSARKNYKELTCVWCRSRWGVSAPAGNQGGVTKRSGFLNLAGAAGIDSHRDTSTYYHGPRRGQHYFGFNTYEDD